MTTSKQNGLNLPSATYSFNRLNQYSQRTVPGYTEAQGIAQVGATVTVNSLPTCRRGKYYWKELTVSNGSNPAYVAVSISAALARYTTQTQTGAVFVARSPEGYTHTDGNLTQDGRWDYTWDDENRLPWTTTLGRCCDARWRAKPSKLLARSAGKRL